MSNYVDINGVWRYDTKNDSPCDYDFASMPETITIPRRLLEREIRRTITEALVEGGFRNVLAKNCMHAVDADVFELSSHFMQAVDADVAAINIQ